MLPSHSQYTAAINNIHWAGNYHLFFQMEMFLINRPISIEKKEK